VLSIGIKSSTLDDLELLEVEILLQFCTTSRVCETTTAERMQIDHIFIDGIAAH